MQFLYKADKAIELLTKLIAVVLFATIIIIGISQVFCRYVINSSLSWSEEVMRYAFIWMVFIGASVTIRREGHVVVDILINYLPDKAKLALYIFTRFLMLVFLFNIIPAGFELCKLTMVSLTSATQVPFAYVYASLPVGGLFMFLALLSTVPKYVKRHMNGGMSADDSYITD